MHVVLFRQGETVLAYRNMCPHFLLPLNAGPGRFIMLKDGLVMCAWHSAVFRVSDGAGGRWTLYGRRAGAAAVDPGGGMLRLGGTPPALGTQA